MNPFLEIAKAELQRFPVYPGYVLMGLAGLLVLAIPFRFGRWRVVQALGALVLGAVAVVGEQAVLQGQFPWGFGVQGAAAILLALFIWPSAERELPAPGPKPPLRRMEVLLLLGVVLLSAFFRLFRIGELGARFHIDEAIKGSWGLEVLNGRPYTPIFNEKEGLFVYWNALYLWLFGDHLVVVKLTAVTIGILTSIALFYLGRWLWNTEVGLAAGALFALSPWAICTNRLAERLNLPPLTSALAVLAYLWATAKGGWWRPLIAGGVVAVGLSSFPPYRMVPPLLVGLFLFQCIRERGFLRRNWFGISFLLLAGAFAAGVLAIHHGDKQLVLTHYLGTQGHGNKLARDWIDLQANIKESLLSIPYRGVPDMSYDPHGDPLEHPFVAVLLLLGLGWSLRYFYNTRYLLMLAWALASLAPTLASNVEPRRFTLIMPVVALLGGLVLTQGVRLTARMIPKLEKPLALLGCCALLFPLVPRTYDLIFKRYYPVFGVPLTYYFAQAQFLRDAGTYFYTLSTPIREEAGKYYLRFTQLGAPEGLYPYQWDGEEVWDLLPLSVQPDRDVLFGVQDVPANRRYLPVFKQFYPGSFVTTHRDRQGRDLFHSVFIPRSEVLGIQGLNGEIQHPGGEPLRFVSRDGRLWPQNFPEARQLSGPLTVRWKGTTIIRDSGKWIWTVQTPGAARLSFDGQEAPLQEGTASVFLAKGMHQMEVSADLPDPGAPVTLGRSGPKQSDPIIRQGTLFTTPLLDNPLRAVATRPSPLRFTFTRSFPVQNPATGEIFNPRWLESDAQGNWYVADFVKRRIVILNHDGTYRTDFDPHAQPMRPGEYRLRFTVTPTGDCLVAEENTLRRFGPDGKLIREYPRVTGIIWDIAEDHLGNISIMSGNSIVTMNPEGRPIRQWGRSTPDLDGFDWAYSITEGQDGLFHILDIGLLAVKNFTLDGKYVSSTPHPYHSQFSDLKISPTGYRYVLTPIDRHNVFVYDAEGRLLIDASLPDPERLIPFQGAPSSVALGPDEEVAVYYFNDQRKLIHCFQGREK